MVLTTEISYPRTAATANQSGGSIKTTTGTSLAAEAVKRGLSVLFACLDSQCNGSKIFGWEWLAGVGRPYAPEAKTIYDVLIKRASPLEAIHPARTRIKDKPEGTDEDEYEPGHEDEFFEEIPNLDVLIGAQDMADADFIIAGLDEGNLWLRNVIEEIHEKSGKKYDLIILDAPASLGKLMVSIIVASTELIGCVLPSGKEIEAIIKLEHSIANVQKTFGKFGVKPELTAVVVGRVHFTKDGRVNPYKGNVYVRSINNLRSAYGDLVMPLVREDVRVPESYEAQTALPFYDENSGIVEDYAKVADGLNIVRRHS